MKYYCNLYLSEEFQTKKEEIIERLEKKQFQVDKYLIVLASNAVNQLDFFDSMFLQQKLFEQDELFVIGIAKGYHEALMMVEKITQEVYDITKDTNLREYLLDKQKEFEESMV